MEDATRSANDARSLSMATTRNVVNPSVILMSAEHAELVGVSKPCKTDQGGCAIAIVCLKNGSWTVAQSISASEMVHGGRPTPSDAFPATSMLPITKQWLDCQTPVRKVASTEPRVPSFPVLKTWR